MATETTSDGGGSPPDFAKIGRPIHFGKSRSGKCGERKAKGLCDRRVKTQSETQKSGTKRAAEDEPDMAPPSHRRKIECMTFKESLRIFNYGASFTTRLLNDIDMDMLVLDDWESRLAFFSTEAVGEMTLASELIVEGRGLEYDPQGDIRALRGGWQRVIRGGRDLGWRKKTRRRNIRRGGDVGWWKVPRPKGWVGIRRGQGEIREAVRRMEAALVGEKSD